MTWFEIAPGHFVLELDEPAIELHVVGWFGSVRGTWLGCPKVGSA